MKRLFPFIALIILEVACNSTNSEQTKTADEIKADSLDNQVEKLHGNAMGKTMHMRDVQKKVETVIDSISKLPAKLRPASATYKHQLDSLLDRMKYADFAMEKWMEEYKFDSLKDDVQKRIEYLESENIKISKVKDAIVLSLQQADSLLRKK
jgi:hypothetical protein